MKSFSISRVAHYARYHYSVTRFNYLSYILAMIALPTLFGILCKNLYRAWDMLIPIYIFAGIAMAVTTTRTMRGRGTKIMDSVLPVTAAERHVFNVVNLAVVYPVLFAIVATVVLGIVSIFNESSWTFCEVYSELAEYTLLDWAVYVLIQIGCSTALLINLLARRSLILAYMITFFGSLTLFVLFVLGMQWLSGNVEFSWSFNPTAAERDVIRYILETIFCLIPVVIYTLCYIVLRKRQVKW